jgi:hypothetical protein
MLTLILIAAVLAVIYGMSTAISFIGYALLLIISVCIILFVVLLFSIRR